LTTGRKISIPVYVGENPKASENEYLGLVEYELPANVPSRTPVTVQFNYDRNRILKVRVEVEGRQELSHEAPPRRHATLQTSVGDDKWRIHLRNALSFAEMMIEQYGEFIDPEQRKTLEEDMDSARQAEAERDAVSGQQALSKLVQTVDDLGIASRLLVVDRLMHDVDPKTAQWLAEQSKKLRDAYRARDETRVARIRRDLEIEIQSIIEQLPEGKGAGYRGLLESIRDSE